MSENKEFTEQDQVVIGKVEIESLAADGLLSDPFLVNSFLELIDFMRQKVAPQLRKQAFERMLTREVYTKEGDVFYMKGADFNITEQQTAQKLSKAGYFVVFPGKGQIKKIKEQEADTDKRKNDVYIYDKKTFLQKKVDLKTTGNPSIKTVSEHIRSGSGQAPVIALDITGKMSKTDLIQAIRKGWTMGTHTILLSYNGKWYDINHTRAFDKEWLNHILK
jgi:hypothetical protein